MHRIVVSHLLYLKWSGTIEEWLKIDKDLTMTHCVSHSEIIVILKSKGYN